MNSNHEGWAGLGLGLAAFLMVVALALIVWLFVCFCLKRICEKCNVKPGVLIWIPILNCIPLLQAAGLPALLVLLWLLPPIWAILWIILWVKICVNRGKSALLVIGVLLLPFIFIPYLAFAD